MTIASYGSVRLDQTGLTTSGDRRWLVLPTNTALPEAQTIQKHVRSHLEMLTGITPEISNAKPLLYMRLAPMRDVTPGISSPPTSGTTASKINAAARRRYGEIEEQLELLRAPDEDGTSLVESGAVDTAQAIVRQLQSRELAPPEITWLGDEAIVMLWALGDTKFALTVTDGEYGYVLRRARTTVLRKAGVSVENFPLEVWRIR